MENLTVLPYLRIYFRVLNAIEKSCFETLLEKPYLEKADSLSEKRSFQIKVQRFCHRAVAKASPSSDPALRCYSLSGHQRVVMCVRVQVLVEGNAQGRLPGLPNVDYGISLSLIDLDGVAEDLT